MPNKDKSRDYRLSKYFLLFLITNMLFLPTLAFGQGGSNFENAVEITSGKITSTWNIAENEFYKINLVEDQLLSISLDVPEGTNIDIFLYDPKKTDASSDSSNLLKSSNNENTGIDEEIKYTAVETGYHYLKLVGSKYSGTGQYELDVFVTEFEILFEGWGTEASPKEVAPGDLGANFNIILRNGGGFDVNDLSLEITLNEYFTNRTGGSRLYDIKSSTIKSGETISFNFLVNIDEDSPLTKQNLPLTIEFKKSEDKVRGIPIVTEIHFTVTGRNFVKLSIDKQDLVPDEYNDITFTIKNEGTAKTGIIDFVLNIPTPLILIGSDNKWSLSSIAPNNEITLNTQIYVPLSEAGKTVQISGQLTFSNSLGTQQTETRTLDIKINKLEGKGIEVVNSFWGKTNDEISVEPGDNKVRLSVTIQNRNTGPISGVQGTLVLENPFSGNTNGKSSSTFFGQSILSGATATSEFLLNIDQNAQIGNYKIKIIFSYLDKDSILQNQEVEFTVDIEGKSKTEINLINNLLISGTENNVILEIKNTGTAPMHKVNIEMLTTPVGAAKLSIVDGNTKRHITKIDPNENVKIEYPIYISANAIEGLSEISISVEYRNTNGLIKVTNTNLVFIIKEWESPFDVSLSDNLLYSGKVTEKEILIFNNGDEKMKNINVDLVFPSNQQGSSPIFLNSGDSDWKINELNQLESATIYPQIFATLDSKDQSYPVQISLSYTDSKGYPHKETQQVSFSVRGNINVITQEPSLSPQVISIGRNSTFSGSLLNKGDTEGIFSEIRIISSEFISTSEESYQYIGELDPDTPIPFSLKFGLTDEAKEGIMQIAIEIKFEDEYGNVFRETEELGLIVKERSYQYIDETNTEENEEPSNNPINNIPTEVVAGVAGFLLLLIIFIRNRRKNKNPF